MVHKATPFLAAHFVGRSSLQLYLQINRFEPLQHGPKKMPDLNLTIFYKYQADLEYRAGKQKMSFKLIRKAKTY
jgi:hypothetical protein